LVLADVHLKSAGTTLETDAIEYFTYFLNKSNHAAGIPLDYVSYHWYGTANGHSVNKTSGQWVGWWLFEQADAMLVQAAKLQAIVNQLSPSTKVNVDEIGSLYGCGDVLGADRSYFNGVGAVYAYVYSELAELGVEIMAASQLVGYGYPSEYPRQIWPSPGMNSSQINGCVPGPGSPGCVNSPGALERNNFPCVTMLSWVDGSGTARFWTLKMMIDLLGGADTRKSVVATTVRPAAATAAAGNSSSSIYAKGFAIRDATCSGASCPTLRRVLLLVNKANVTGWATVSGAKGMNASKVDYTAGHGHIPYSTTALDGDTFPMLGWAVHLLVM
jgi:hypothetical protein